MLMMLNIFVCLPSRKIPIRRMATERFMMTDFEEIKLSSEGILESPHF